jgi:hypothetical protein
LAFIAENKCTKKNFQLSLSGFISVFKNGLELENKKMKRILKHISYANQKLWSTIRERKRRKCEAKIYRSIFLVIDLCLFNNFSIIFNGISNSLEIMPELENIVLRLLTSACLIAPTNGAEII